MKKILKTIAAFALIGILFLVGANAYMGNYQTVGPNYTEERHEMMEGAFDSSSYLDWYNLMIQDGRSPSVLRFVNEDNFDTFTQMHEAMKEGNFEKADQLREEIGMGQVGLRGQGQRGMGENRGQRQGGQGSNTCSGSGSCGSCPYRN